MQAPLYTFFNKNKNIYLMSDYKMNQMVNQDHLKVKASQLPSIKCLLLCACACNFIAINLILKLGKLSKKITTKHMENSIS